MSALDCTRNSVPYPLAYPSCGLRASPARGVPSAQTLRHTRTRETRVVQIPNLTFTADRHHTLSMMTLAR